MSRDLPVRLTSAAGLSTTRLVGVAAGLDPGGMATPQRPPCSPYAASGDATQHLDAEITLFMAWAAVGKRLVRLPVSKNLTGTPWRAGSAGSTDTEPANAALEGRPACT